MRGRTATDDGAAAWSHRGTLVGELAARTSLRGDVEVAHPATFPCYSRVPHRPSELTRVHQMQLAKIG